MNTGSSTSEQKQYLTFHVSGEEFAIGVLQVKEIIPYEQPTRVPGMPHFVRGVINLRGSVVPVIDLALRLGMPDSGVHKRACIVIAEVKAEGERLVMGVKVDSVDQVLALAPQDIEPPPAFGTQVRADYLVGLGKLGQRFALLLDLDRVLVVQELMGALEGVEQPARTPGG
ncbi:chemotaxis protein CheW [Vitiosangium sp. GDMCC 1.1324]|uniref:chemotaxis protein CheW n=1 Tax=Vitiosangium sp. (strain GDMCC 1.1324) TaxID=2138576 RepID=UPI000D392056|nr:chemotaxis protein CheW [Vitiosangium sp. GDMCC 1.1324]PTL76431.1 chemotaxis protein CheW [Vitiosangium sp. GDMCC 1.1324]